MKEKLWTKDFWAITIISFIIFFVFYVLLTLLPIYISDRLHASPDKAGLLVTLFLIAAIVIRPFAGQWVGKYSNKTILGLSSLAFLVVTALYPFCHSIESLLFYSGASWYYLRGYHYGKRNDFRAADPGLPTWGGHQFFLSGNGAGNGGRAVDWSEYGALGRL